MVQQGDNIYSIAEMFGIAVERLAYDNGLIYPYDLVVGQTIVIAYPKQVYVVQEGDTLPAIAAVYGVTPMQIIRNNSFLLDRDYLVIGETLVISYNTNGSIVTNGFAYPYVRMDTLIKALPNLTYLTIFNYTTVERGDIQTFNEDDAELVALVKEFGVIPLMMLTTLTPQGVPNVELAYEMIINQDYLENNLDQAISIMKQKGYYGVNIIYNYLTESNQYHYYNNVRRVSERLRQEGLLFFATINYDISIENNEITFNQIDYSQFSPYVDGLIFLNFVWGTNYGPPAPVSNINYIRAIIEYAASLVPADQILIGKPLLGYDWQLPYIEGRTYANSMSIESALNLAYETGSVIQFDEDSQTPYFYYNQFNFGAPMQQHIVWFIDARSINVLDDVIQEYMLAGSGVWNVMSYYPQLWTIMNARFDIIKLIET